MKIITSDKPHCDVFEELVEKGEIKYETPMTDEWIRENGDAYWFLQIPLSHDFEFLIGDVGLAHPESKAPPSLSFKVAEEAFFSYFEVYPHAGQFMWVEDNEHHKSIHPDVALGFLMNKQFGVDVSVVEKEDGTTIMDVGGIKVVDERRKKDGS